MPEPIDPSPPSLPDVQQAVRQGTRVVLATQVATQVVSLGVLAAMLRLVAPDDYGLLGMLLPAVMLPRMAATLGLSTAVLQRERSPSELSSLFWINVVGGLAAAAVTAGCGRLLAWAYDRPLLGPLALALAGSTFIAALGNQHEALLQRKLLLLPLSAVRLLALVCGGFAGIYSARRGAGVWALVAQQYGELVVLTVWVWLLEPWRPGWPAGKQPGAGVGGLLRFSGYYSLSQLVYFVAQNLDKVLLPLLLGASADRAVGLYGQAFSLMMKPVYLLTSPLSGVLVAGLSQARVDRQTHAALATRFFRLVAIGLFPCAAGLFVVASDAMALLGGPRWQASGWILAALAPAMFAQGLANLGMLLLASAGKSGRLLGATLLLVLLLVQGGLVGIFLGRTYLPDVGGGPDLGAALGLALGYSVVLIGVWFGPFLWFCLKSADVPLAPVLLPLWPALRAALLMGLAVWALGRLPQVQSLGPAIRLPLVIAVGVAIYGLLARRELMWCWQEVVLVRSHDPAT